MLTVLHEALAKAKTKGADQDLVEDAESLLASRVSSIARFCSMYGTTPGGYGLKRMRKLPDEQWPEIQSPRREIAQITVLLSKE